MKKSTSIVGYGVFILTAVASMYWAYEANVRNISLISEIESWRRVIKNFPSGIVIVDANTGDIIDTNDGALEIFDRTLIDMLRSDVPSLMVDGTRDKHIGYFGDKRIFDRWRFNILVFDCLINEKTYTIRLQSLYIDHHPHFLVFINETNSIVSPRDDRLRT